MQKAKVALNPAARFTVTPCSTCSRHDLSHMNHRQHQITQFSSVSVSPHQSRPFCTLSRRPRPIEQNGRSMQPFGWLLARSACSSGPRPPIARSDVTRLSPAVSPLIPSVLSLHVHICRARLPPLAVIQQNTSKRHRRRQQSPDPSPRMAACMADGCRDSETGEIGLRR